MFFASSWVSHPAGLVAFSVPSMFSLKSSLEGTEVQLSPYSYHVKVAQRMSWEHTFGFYNEFVAAPEQCCCHVGRNLGFWWCRREFLVDTKALDAWEMKSSLLRWPWVSEKLQHRLLFAHCQGWLLLSSAAIFGNGDRVFHLNAIYMQRLIPW